MRPLRVLGIDPGLTRCGLGVVEGVPGRVSLVAVGVTRTPAGDDLGARLVALEVAFEVVSEATDTHAVRLACTSAGLEVQSADIAWMPTLSVPLEDKVAVKVLRLVEALEDLDDVQNVWANFDVSDEVLEQVG